VAIIVSDPTELELPCTQGVVVYDPLEGEEQVAISMETPDSQIDFTYSEAAKVLLAEQVAALAILMRSDPRSMKHSRAGRNVRGGGDLKTPTPPLLMTMLCTVTLPLYVCILKVGPSGWLARF
jgi:hypothetical protein